MSALVLALAPQILVCSLLAFSDAIRRGVHQRRERRRIKREYREFFARYGSWPGEGKAHFTNF